MMMARMTPTAIARMCTLITITVGNAETSVLTAGWCVSPGRVNAGTKDGATAIQAPLVSTLRQIKSTAA